MRRTIPVLNDAAALRGGIDLRLVWCNRHQLPRQWGEGPVRMAPDVTCFVLAEKNGFWVSVNNCPIQVREGDLVVIRSGDTYSWRSIGVSIRLLSMGLSVCQLDGRDLLGERAFARHYRLRDLAGYRARFDAIFKQLRAGGDSDKTRNVLHAVLDWLVHLLRETRAPVRRMPKLRIEAVQRVLKAQAWAEEHLNQPITLDEWAGSVGWSAVQFGRVFRAETGYRPMRWLEERRVELASELLLNSNLNVTRVSERVGYANPFYFSRVFKKHRAVSPQRYRHAAEPGRGREGT